MNAATNVLVKAYAEYHAVLTSCDYETVYFKDANGSIYSSGKRKVNNAFNPKGQAWTLASHIPEHADFIGNYVRPHIEAPRAVFTAGESRETLNLIPQTDTLIERICYDWDADKAMQDYANDL